MASAVSAQVRRIFLQASRQPAKASFSRSASTLACAFYARHAPSTPITQHRPDPSPAFHPLLLHSHSNPFHRTFAAPAKRTIPTLNATLRRFYFLVHPDLFHSHPEHRAINEQNMQHFLGFVTAMKQTNSDQPWPPAQHTNLTFYIRRKAGDKINTRLSFIEYNEQHDKKHSHHNKTKRRPPPTTYQPPATDGDFHVLRLTLSTNGGNCRGPVEKQLRHLFAMLALPEEFRWDDEYWQMKPPVKRGGSEDDGEDDDEYEYA